MDLNLRSLKRVDEGYTLIPTSKDHVNRNLCAHCATKGCMVKSYHATWAATADAAIVTETTLCSMYTPPIGFNDRSGLVDGCNTIRLGKAWSERVREGDTVAFLDTSTNQLFGKATVAESLHGTPDKILYNHSMHNHLFTGSGVKKGRARTEMVKMLPKIYGNLYWEQARYISVIYFDNVKIFGEKL